MGENHDNSPKDDPPILVIKNVTKIFSNNIIALKDVNLSISRGDFLVISGPNGSGKSVLMSLVAALDCPTSGEINFSEKLKTGLVFQDANAGILGETVEEDVAFGARNMGLKGDDLQKAIDCALNAVSLLEKKTDSARVLSGGQKRRLATAGVLSMGCDLIIFDEPFANMDYPSILEIIALLKDLKRKKKTVIVLTHEIEKVLALATKFAVLFFGEVKFFGTPNEALKLPLEIWGVREPFKTAHTLRDLLWM